MGLDIYAGTLTRYYAHNWKTAVQQWAEANGYDCTIMRPAAAEAEEEEKLSADEIREVVETWRDDLLGALSQYSEEPYEPWPEDEEKPYFTDKPDWDAYNALRLFAFHVLLDKPLPEKFPRRGACEDFISMSEEEKEKAEGLSLCGGAEWWLPLKEQFTFSADTPAGNEAAFGTAGMLAAELKYINDKVWQAGEEEILKWNGTGRLQSGGAVYGEGRIRASSRRMNAKARTMTRRSLNHSRSSPFRFFIRPRSSLWKIECRC